MVIISLIIISLSILIAFAIVIRDIKNGKYEVTEEETILSKEAEEKYLKEFPNHSIEDLKLEIEKVADIFVDNQESNRYTELLRQKAKNDEKISKLKDAVIEDVEIIKYNRGILKARINYKDYVYKYKLILNMNTVTRGRVFLNNYFVFKDGKRYEV